MTNYLENGFWRNTAMFVPLIILMVGIYILLNSTSLIEKDNNARSNTAGVGLQNNVGTAQNDPKQTVSITPKVPAVDIIESRFNSSEAYPYFLLSAITLVALLVLPKLQELSITPTSVTLKLLEQVDKDVQDLLTTTDPNIQMDPGHISNIRERLVALKTKIEALQTVSSKR